MLAAACLNTIGSSHTAEAGRAGVVKFDSASTMAWGMIQSTQDGNIIGEMRHAWLVAVLALRCSGYELTGRIEPPAARFLFSCTARWPRSKAQP
jgi:hypothetical protein